MMKFDQFKISRVIHTLLQKNFIRKNRHSKGQFTDMTTQPARRPWNHSNWWKILQIKIT